MVGTYWAFGHLQQGDVTFYDTLVNKLCKIFIISHGHITKRNIEIGVFGDELNAV